MSAAESNMSENPFFSESTLAFNMPPFDRITDADYVPAFERGMAEQLREIQAIASNPENPTFENTIVAMERSGRILSRVSAVFDNLKGADTDPKIQEIDNDMAPKRSDQADAIYLNPALFARVDALFRQRASLGLDPESLRLLEHYHRDFVRAGAQLSEAGRERMKALNSEVASLQTTFSQNVLKEKNADSVTVGDPSELAGLEPAEIAAYRKGDGYSIPLQNTTGQQPLASLQSRALRERIMEASLARGSHGGPYDNRAVVARLAKLRAEQAALREYAGKCQQVNGRHHGRI